jgi:hypothetical protein
LLIVTVGFDDVALLKFVAGDQLSPEQFRANEAQKDAYKEQYLKNNGSLAGADQSFMKKVSDLEKTQMTLLRKELILRKSWKG